MASVVEYSLKFVLLRTSDAVIPVIPSRFEDPPSEIVWSDVVEYECVAQVPKTPAVFVKSKFSFGAPDVESTFVSPPMPSPTIVAVVGTPEVPEALKPQL